jgi:uncharacterized membrane protein (UPF0127 family)
MKDTLIPLSIAFFGADGGFVSDADMVPCPPGTACPTYGAAGEYTTAVEVPAGGLPERGLVEGATLTVSDDDCVRG